MFLKFSGGQLSGYPSGCGPDANSICFSHVYLDVSHKKLLEMLFASKSHCPLILLSRHRKQLQTSSAGNSQSFFSRLPLASFLT